VATSMSNYFDHALVIIIKPVAKKMKTVQDKYIYSGKNNKTRNSSGDEIANANFFYDDIVHEFGEITQNKRHYAVQADSMSPILIPIDSLYTTSC